MSGVLTVHEGDAERRVVFEERAVVGRDPDCAVVLRSRSVSRRHALLEKSADGWVARDLGSANGLFVEGKRVGEAPLRAGAAVRFGDVEAVFDTAGTERSTSAERLAASLSVRPAPRARPVAVFVVTTLGVLALVAATVWARYCDRTDGGRPPASAPAR